MKQWIKISEHDYINLDDVSYIEIRPQSVKINEILISGISEDVTKRLTEKLSGDLEILTKEGDSKAEGYTYLK